MKSKRIFDFTLSLFGLIILSPLFILISIAVLLDSKGKIFYRQIRVGKNNKDFYMYKFRTMISGSDKKGLLTIGEKDNRITRIGVLLRKYKMDELPQLINVLIGDMSVVGPRPEVRKYVDLYNEEQLKIFNVKPGITDYSSIEFIDESKLLAEFSDPEDIYIREIMPAKLKLNLKYINQMSLKEDIKILTQTILKIIKRK